MSLTAAALSAAWGREIASFDAVTPPAFDGKEDFIDPAKERDKFDFLDFLKRGPFEMIDQMGGMDLFFYAAGVGKQNRDLKEDIELMTTTTNGLGFVRMIGEAFRYFAERGEGHIAAITSIAGTKGLGPAPSYSATKAMQNVYLQALEQQANARGLNIYFTDIRPGFVDTALLNGDFHYPMMMKPDVVARQIVRAIKHKKHICVINWKYRLLTMAWRRIPRFIWRRMKL